MMPDLPLCSVDQVCAAMRAAPSESVVQINGCLTLRDLACWGGRLTNTAAVRAAGAREVVVTAMERFKDVVCEDDDDFCRHPRPYASAGSDDVPRTCQKALNCIERGWCCLW